MGQQHSYPSQENPGFASTETSLALTPYLSQLHESSIDVFPSRNLSQRVGGELGSNGYHAVGPSEFAGVGKTREGRKEK